MGPRLDDAIARALATLDVDRARYQHHALVDFLSRLVGARVMPCPENDIWST